MTNPTPIVTGSGDPYEARYITVTMIAQVLQGGIAVIQYQTADGRILYLPKSEWENVYVPVLSSHMVMDVGVS